MGKSIIRKLRKMSFAQKKNGNEVWLNVKLTKIYTIAKYPFLSINSVLRLQVRFILGADRDYRTVID